MAAAPSVVIAVVSPTLDALSNRILLGVPLVIAVVPMVMPDVGEVQLATPVPSVVRTWPDVPAVVGRVRLHVPAAAAVLMPTVPLVLPLSVIEPATVLAPSVRAPLETVALALPDTAVPVAE
jgi:hypothetical protein